MNGTVITYQGLPCESVTFNRSRGFRSNASQVVLPLAALGVKVPLLGEVGARAAPAEIDADTLFGDKLLEALVLAERIAHEGTLLMAEAEGAEVWKVEVPHLFVVRADTEIRAKGLHVVKLTLADERYMWGKGLMGRWSFNRLRASGGYAFDSLDPKGRPLSLAKILVDEVAPSLFRSIEVDRFPRDWVGSVGEVSLRPWETAENALRTLISSGHAEDPCLRLDGKLGIHLPGDSDQVLKHAFVLAARGLAQAVEFGYPEDYLLVVGEPKIATVVLDDWEPVLFFDGVVHFMSDELIARMTGDAKLGLKWLAKFVLRSGAEQEMPGVDDKVLAILREQAWRLFRIPGAEKISEGFYSGEDGRNAHLLPMLDRAETTGGRRLPPMVRTYRWKIVRRHLAGGKSSADLLRAQVAIAVLRKQLSKVAASLGIQLRGRFERDQAGQRVDDLVLGKGLLEEDGSSDFDKNRLRAFMSQLRQRAAEAEKVPSVIPGQLKKAQEDRLAALDKISGSSLLATWKLAEELLKIESKAQESRGAFDNALGDAVDELESLQPQVEQAIRRARQKIRKQRLATQTSGKPAEERILTAVAMKNLPRAEAAGARVFNAGLGLIKTRELAGHVLETGKPLPAMTEFVHCPVQVAFGAQTRPRIDLPPGTKSRVQTSGVQEAPSAEHPCTGGENYLPGALSDRDAYYSAAYKRTGRGSAERIRLAQLPLSQATRVARKWTQLVPLEGEGNVAELDRQAKEVASNEFKRPELTRGNTYSLARPWAIECDGQISGVTIKSETKVGAPCGFTTTVHVGTTKQPTTLKSVARQSTDDQREAFRP